MDSSSPPATPDPVLTANAQGDANVKSAQTTAALNRANQYTPYGSLTWKQGDPTRTFNQSRYDSAVAAAQKAGSSGQPAGHFATSWSGDNDYQTWVPDPVSTAGAQSPDRNADQFYDMTPSNQWSSTVTLDPRVQSLLDSDLSTSQKLQGAVGNSLNQVNDVFSHAPPVASEALRKQVEDATYGRYTSRLDPEYGQQEEALRSSLMNRGITEGSDAWKNVTDSFGRAKNDAYQQAREAAVQQGGNEEARQLGMDQSSRLGVLNELNALRSGAQAQVPNFPQTPSGASVNPAPIGQSIWNSYQGNMNQYSADVASNNGTMAAGAGALATIAAAFI